MLNQITGKLKNGVGRAVRRFVGNEKGAFAPLFALSAIALMLSAGAALDYSQMSRFKSIMAGALDAAILATGHQMSEGETDQKKLRAIFQDQLFGNLDNYRQIAAATTITAFKANPVTGEVDAALGAPLQTAFMGLMGKPRVDIAVTSQAKFSHSDVEVSMVLDLTGSMNDNGKLASLKRAASNAVNILLPKDRNSDNIRVGLVPYSEGVSLPGSLALKASGQSRRTCMTERRLNPAVDLSFASELVGADSRADCSYSMVQPLTNDRKALLDNITAFRANGYTAGHSGITWGYYMLSDKWKRFWPTGSEPAAYDSKTRKIVILMTDGEFNTYFQGVSDYPRGYQSKRSNDTALKLCRDMKRAKGGDEGITIYSIAFDAPKAAKETLQECATPKHEGHNFYFEAKNEAELATVFETIAGDIKALRLTR